MTYCWNACMRSYSRSAHEVDVRYLLRHIRLTGCPHIIADATPGVAEAHMDSSHPYRKIPESVIVLGMPFESVIPHLIANAAPAVGEAVGRLPAAQRIRKPPALVVLCIPLLQPAEQE